MTAVDAVPYKNGQKNHWRRTMWNAVSTLLHPEIPKRDAIVIYLPGSTDLDREEAVRRGFNDANLIAVERDEAVARHLRRAGRTVINAELDDVLANWPIDRPIGAVIADMQCGLERNLIPLLAVLAMAHPLRFAAVALNLQRGRERGDFRAHAQALIEEARADPDFDSLSADPRTPPHVRSLLSCGPLHRGAQAFMTMLHLEHVLKPVPDDSAGQLTIMRSAFTKLPSYRSTPRSPIFDSAVMRIGGFRGEFYTKDCAGALDVKHKIRAALAIRTRRRRGSLPSATRLIPAASSARMQ